MTKKIMYETYRAAVNVLTLRNAQPETKANKKILLGERHLNVKQ